MMCGHHSRLRPAWAPATDAALQSEDEASESGDEASCFEADSDQVKDEVEGKNEDTEMLAAGVLLSLSLASGVTAAGGTRHASSPSLSPALEEMLGQPRAQRTGKTTQASQAGTLQQQQKQQRVQQCARRIELQALCYQTRMELQPSTLLPQLCPHRRVLEPPVYGNLRQGMGPLRPNSAAAFCFLPQLHPTPLLLAQ